MPVGFLKKLFAFGGPAFLISVGYMDPGNWATDIAGGSKFGYSLIWVLLMSNLMALLLQSLSARLGLVRGRDLAQASRETYPPIVNFFLYILAEIAIAACDLAEVLGMAIGLQLLFHLPLLVGVSISVLDTILLLLLQQMGMRKMEAFIITLIGIIGLAFFAEMIFAKPDLGEVVKGFVPSILHDSALYIAIGIIGATVMPHNLYLHSALVQTRKFDNSEKGIRTAIKFNIIDSAIALNLAFFVNAAILILAAAAFYNHGLFEIAQIQDAYKLLAPMLGNSLAPILFAIALIAAGQSSTLTGTLSGQIVMEGYLNLRIQPWLRRLITRLIAIVPAFLVIYIFGESKTGELLIFSQVLLSIQLGFAVIPLIHFVSDKNTMGIFAIKPLMKFGAWLCAFIIVSLNGKLVLEQVLGWIEQSPNPLTLWTTVVPIVIISFILLVYITFSPFFKILRRKPHLTPHIDISPIQIGKIKKYKLIAISVDFSKTDNKAINTAIQHGGKEAAYLLIHIVETAGAIMMGSDIKDFETQADVLALKIYTDKMTELGYCFDSAIGYGNPKTAIPKIINQTNPDLLVMGTHGHKALKDILFGTTLDAVRHGVDVPIFIVK